VAIGMAALGTSLSKNPFMSSTLTYINLSYNKLEPEVSLDCYFDSITYLGTFRVHPLLPLGLQNQTDSAT